MCEKFIDKDRPEFLGGPKCVIMNESPLEQIERKLGAVKVLFKEIDAIAKQLRQGTSDPDIYDRELETAASDLGFELSKLFGKALRGQH